MSTELTAQQQVKIIEDTVTSVMQHDIKPYLRDAVVGEYDRILLGMVREAVRQVGYPPTRSIQIWKWTIWVTRKR